LNDLLIKKHVYMWPPWDRCAGENGPISNRRLHIVDG
jgi:hypothetical protein